MRLHRVEESSSRRRTMDISALGGDAGNERPGRHHNVSARLSLCAAIGGFAAVLVFTGEVPVLRSALASGFRTLPSLRILGLSSIPVAGLVAVISGVVGLTRVDATGGGRGQAWAGLLGGTLILVLTAGVLWLLWSFAHSDWQFS
jgi:hypothetical protein